MNLQHIQYIELNPLQKEAFNFQKAAAVLAEYGFTCIWNKTADGTDFLAKHKDGETLRVQLTSRLVIDKKWQGKDLFVLFPVQRNRHAKRTWYLVCHDSLVGLIADSSEFASWLQSDSWRCDGRYSRETPPEEFLEDLSAFALGEAC